MQHATAQKSGETPLSTSIGRIAPLFEQARQAGLALPDAFAALNLPPDLAERPPDFRLSLADYYRIQNHFVHRLGDETFHLSPRHLSPGSTDMVLSNLEGCSNLYEVMQVVARSYNVLHGGQYNSVERKKETVDYVIDDRDFPYTLEGEEDYIFFSIECILIFLHCILMMVSAELATDAVRGIAIRRLKGGGQLRHLAYWRAPIRFGAPHYRLRVERKAALEALPEPPPKALTSNALYLKIVEVVSVHHSNAPHRLKTTAAVRDALSRGIVEQNQVALQIGVSVATLRRRLSEEGVSFRALRREALDDAAKHLLASGRSVQDVAEKLGFAEFRSFNRAFKEWNGITPKKFQGDLAHPAGAGGSA